MKIEVVYLTNDSEFFVSLEMPDGASVQQAVEQSRLLDKHPDISFDKNEVGIFSELVPLNAMLHEGDRVEVYRPLTIDPMEARRLRAKSLT